MKEKIENLIQHHKEACQECKQTLEELVKIDSTKMSAKEERLLEETIKKLEDEYSWRKLFLQDLNDLL